MEKFSWKTKLSTELGIKEEQSVGYKSHKVCDRLCEEMARTDLPSQQNIISNRYKYE